MKPPGAVWPSGTRIACVEDVPVSEPLDQVRLLDCLDPRCRGALAATTTVHEAVRGQVLWKAGDPPQGMAVILSGFLKTVRPSRRGSVGIGSLMRRLDSLGAVSALSGGSQLADAVVVSDSALLLWIPRASLLSVAHCSPEFRVELLDAVQRETDSLWRSIDLLSATRVEVRLASFFVGLCEDIGRVAEDGSIRLPVLLTRGDLAEFAATTSETVSRIASVWGRARLVVSDVRGVIVHDLAALRAIAGITEGNGRCGARYELDEQIGAVLASDSTSSEPPPARRAVSRPPCSRAICRLTASPMPVPEGLVV
jgi:CRP-like cAMP-binding protein